MPKEVATNPVGNKEILATTSNQRTQKKGYYSGRNTGTKKKQSFYYSARR